MSIDLVKPESVGRFVAIVGGGGVSLPAMSLYLTGDTGVTQSGGTVDAWADQSASGYNFSQVGAARPGYTASGQNGLPNITFDVNQYLTSAAATLAAPYTIFIVARVVNVSGYIFDGTPFDKGGLSYAVTDVRLTPSTGGAITVADTPGATTKLYTAVNTGGASSLVQVNDGTAGTGTGGGSLVAPWLLGGIASAGFSVDGWVNEVRVYPAALSAEQRTAVKAIMNTKWAVY